MTRDFFVKTEEKTIKKKPATLAIIGENGKITHGISAKIKGKTSVCLIFCKLDTLPIDRLFKASPVFFFF